MASLKKEARASCSSGTKGNVSMKKQGRASSSGGTDENRQGSTKAHVSTAGVMELSVTIGYLGADIKVSELGKLEILMHDHCDAGLVAVERGDTESHLHFQMVARARVSSARGFGVLCRKYMGWHGVRNMCPAGKVTCKVLSNRLIHTFKGMIGYCLKDSGASHFAVAMHNISDDDVIAGKTLHSLYGRADLKRRITLTNKNVMERMYVWHKYRENRQLTATFLSTLTEMIRSGGFMPAASWIIPMSGQGMEARRMKSLWRCIVEPSAVDKNIVGDVFVRKREYVRGRYYSNDDDESNLDSHLSDEEGRTPLKSCLKSTDRVVRFEEDPPFVNVSCKGPQFCDELGSFIPLQNPAPMVTDDFLPTVDALMGETLTRVKSEPEFWDSLLCPTPSLADSRSRRAKGKGPIEDAIDVICLSSDEEEAPLVVSRAAKRRLIKLEDK